MSNNKKSLCSPCSGMTLIKGKRGENGNYVEVTAEAAGANCTHGGYKIVVKSGINNSTLSTNYLCNVSAVDGNDGADGIDGVDGDNAYVYIAYASDDIGTGFTTVFDPLLDYIAIKSTTVEIPTPVVGDFTGLWKNYKGEKGDKGDKGDQGDPGVDGINGTDGTNGTNGIDGKDAPGPIQYQYSNSKLY